jgi:hypothetical protein
VQDDALAVGDDLRNLVDFCDVLGKQVHRMYTTAEKEPLGKL